MEMVAITKIDGL